MSLLDGVIWAVLCLILAIISPLLSRLRFDGSSFSLLLGLLIGPVFLGWLELVDVGRLLAEIALVMMLFSAGFEIHWKHFLSAIKPGIIVGLSGIVFCFVAGFAVVYAIDQSMEEALFIATALSATSIGLSLPLLHHQGLLTQRIGQILLAAAIVDDIVALYLLSAIHIGLTTDNGVVTIVWNVLLGLLVIISAIASIYLLNSVIKRNSLYQNPLFRRPLFCLIAGITALITHHFGLSLAVGSFMAGAVLAVFHTPDKNHDSVFFDRIADKISPIFFLTIGLQITHIEVTSLHLLLLSAAVIVIAIVGKLLSPWVIAASLNVPQRWVLGWALVPRAEVALIVASIGFQQGHLSQHGMIAIVIMTLVTALLPSFVIPRLVKRHRSRLMLP